MNPFSLAYREQQQLFLFEKSYFVSTLLQVGGLSSLLAKFIVQFFWNPVTSMILTIALLAVSSYVLWVALRSSKRDWWALGLSIIPSVFVGASISDNNLHFDYLTSIMIVEAGLVIFKRIRSQRVLKGILLTILLYLAAGPAAVLFGVCTFFAPNSGEEKADRQSILYTVTAIICGILASILLLTSSLATSLTPAFHYEINMHMPAIHWIGWISIPFVGVVSRIKRNRIVSIAEMALVVVSLISGIIISGNFDTESDITRCEYEYFTANERWDDLAQSCSRHVWSPGTANYMNLAAAYKGNLCENLFKYDNRGVSSLLMMPEAKTVDIRVAYIMFAMGNMAAAQNVSFNAMFTSSGYAPAMLKMNTRIEIMRGAYEVADKYLSIFEKTIHYRRWAEEQRAFLWDDSKVEDDPLLGNGRNSFPEEDGFAMFGSPIEELMKIIPSNTSDTRAMQYGLAFLLLSKDIARLQLFVDEYWGTPALQSLPTAVQEALVFYSEYSRNFKDVEPVTLEWCTSHGVSQAVIESFAAFQAASIKNGGKAPKGYQKTYWNYLIYEQL